MRAAALAGALLAPAACVAAGPAYLDDRVYCLALVVYSEARGEEPVTQLAVAQTVLNRWASDRRGRTVCDIVMEPGQFAVRRPDYKSDAWVQAVTIADGALRFSPPDVTGGATHFSSGEEEPTWARGMRPLRIGRLTFWRR